MGTTGDRMAAKVAKLEAELAILRNQPAPGLPLWGAFGDLIEHLPTMVFVKSAKDLRFISLNRAGEELLGMPRSAILGKTDYDLFPVEEADFFVAKDRAVLAGRCAVDIPEEPVHTASGERWLHTRKVPLIDADGNPLYLLGLSEDVTDKRRAATELLRKTEALTRSNRDLEQFAMVASHDIKEPLRRIRGYGDLILDEYSATLPPDVLEHIESMRSGAAQLQALVDSLLTYSRVAMQPKQSVWVDLNEIMRIVLSDLEPAARERGAQVEVGPLPVVLGDAQQLRQLLQNLVANALKFVDNSRTPRVLVRGQVHGTVCELSVIDNGIGIAAEHIPKIFSMFQRLHGAQKFAGSGIGLAVCKKIAERHGGTLSVQSTVGLGSTFVVTLPSPAADFQV